MLSNQHPQYVAMLDQWKQMRDFYAGSNAVKANGTKYLPATEGMEIDGMKSGERGFKAYEAYKKRARVPEYIKEGVRAMVGLLHQKPAVISLPDELSYLLNSASSQGETLQALYRRINFEQLMTGRLGLFVDIAVGGSEPYIALYPAESIPNWFMTTPENGESYLSVVVMNESGQVFDKSTFSWTDKVRYRVAYLTDGMEYRQLVTEDDMFNPEDGIAPYYRGKTLDYIPFTFINSQDTLSDVDEPPLSALLDICIGIYMGEADYRQNLYMQGQQTLVVKGGVSSMSSDPGEDKSAVRTGAGARIDVGIEGDAKYIGVQNSGLQEQRIALENDRRRAEVKAGQLVQNSRSQAESGKAMATRYNAQTATLNQLATAAGEGLEKALKTIARWIGADETKVKVTPNTEFIDFSLEGRNFADIMQAIRDSGLPLSLESVHSVMKDRGLTDLDFETEMSKIDSELQKYGPVIKMLLAFKSESEAAAKAINDDSANRGNVA